MNEKEAVATLAAVAAQRNNALNEAAMLAGKLSEHNEQIARMGKEITFHMEENEKLKTTIISNERAISRYKKIKPGDDEANRLSGLLLAEKKLLNTANQKINKLMSDYAIPDLPGNAPDLSDVNDA